MQEIRSNIWLIGVLLLSTGGALLSFSVDSPDLPESTSDAGLQLDSTDDRPINSYAPAFFLDHVHGESVAIHTGAPGNVVDLTDSLRQLHETALIAFEFAPNFGQMRMPPIIHESTPPQHVPLLASRSEASKEGKTSASTDPNPRWAWMWLNEMTGISSKGLVYRRITPQDDVVDRLVYGYPDPRSRSSDAFGDEFLPLPEGAELWRVSSIELIGLWQRESPVVFEQRRTTAFGEMNRGVTTRNLNREEVVAVSKLQSDAQVVATFDNQPSKIRLVGAIRAKQSCTKCHDTTEGSLLGAFSYLIEPLERSEDAK